MLSISHAVTGAVIAVNVSNPILAIPLILLSHYLEDAIAHWDVGTGLSKGLKSRQSAITHEVFDLALAAILIFIYYPSSFPSLQDSQLTIQNYAPIWGGFVGLVPDFLEAPRNFLKYEPAWLKPINRFHNSFHHSIPRIADGLFPQFILLCVLWIIR